MHSCGPFISCSPWSRSAAQIRWSLRDVPTLLFVFAPFHRIIIIITIIIMLNYSILQYGRCSRSQVVEELFALTTLT